MEPARLEGELGALLGGLGRSVGKAFIALLTLFFFYRDGDAVVRQMHRVGRRSLTIDWIVSYAPRES